MTARKSRSIPNGWTGLGQWATVQQPENEAVTTAIEKHWTKISGKFDAEVLLHKLETMAKDNIPNHWTFTMPGAMIRGAIVHLFILFCCLKVCCNSRPATAPYLAPTAPLAPPTIFNMTVDPICR